MGFSGEKGRLEMNQVRNVFKKKHTLFLAPCMSEAEIVFTEIVWPVTDVVTVHVDPSQKHTSLCTYIS